MQILLIIFDGWGFREERGHNAVAQARKPYFDYLWNEYPRSLLKASGEAVGLPEGFIGGSEVGHLTIGSGQVVDSDVVRVTKAIQKNEFGNTSAFKKLFDHVKSNDSFLHVMGMVSTKGVHSHQDHLHEFLKEAKNNGVNKIVIHAFTDGRDSPPQSAHIYLQRLEQTISDLGIGHIATASGRFYAMDRDHNWDRLAKVEAAIFHGQGKTYKAQKPSEVMAAMHQEGVWDEHLEPIVFLDEDGKSYRLSKNDGVFFFNVRADRARMLSERIIERAKTDNLCFVTMTEYDKTFDCLVAFPPKKPQITLGSVLSERGLRQTRIAETEKYAHVTYFFSGGREAPYEGENRILIDSRKDIRTHDEAPEMRTREIADAAIKKIREGADFIVLNFANADMVGHTANFEATVKAVEKIDEELKRVVEEILNADGAAFMTADHGNAEIIFDHETGQPHTAHTTNPVPAILTVKHRKLKDGALADVAPTILELFGITKPAVMTGKSLLTD